MKPGDIAAKAFAPFVKGTKYEDCEPCRKRKERMNNFWTRVCNAVKRRFNK